MRSKRTPELDARTLRGTLRTTHIAVSFTRGELFAVREAAIDAHMSMPEYMRMMTLAAAGCGGVVEHLERAIDASVKASDLGNEAQREAKALAKAKKRGRK